MLSLAGRFLLTMSSSSEKAPLPDKNENREDVPRYPPVLPREIKELFANFGYGCLAIEADIGVIHICHASDSDIEGFRKKNVVSRWQLVKMPTAPLVRLKLVILDRPQSPYLFESFLNISDEDQANVLSRLASQELLYLVLFGDDLEYRYTKVIPQDFNHWQLIDDLHAQALEYLGNIPEEQRDFDRAKADFMNRYP